VFNNKRSKNIYCSVVTLLFAIVQSQLTVAATQMYFVHNDQLGTPVAVTDQSQAVVWEADKKPFGESVITGTVGENTRFPGQLFDEETGLHYNYYRDYDPSLGRYIQSDPIGITRNYSDPKIQMAIKQGIPIIFMDEPESYSPNHSYGYASQNPLSGIDPFGLENIRTTIANNAAGLPNFRPGQKKNHDCKAVCNFKYQLVCTAAGVGAGIATKNPLAGAAVGGSCMFVKLLVCNKKCDEECPVG